jgi:hypothetical protein
VTIRLIILGTIRISDWYRNLAQLLRFFSEAKRKRSCQMDHFPITIH